MKPLISYYGGKQRLEPQIVPILQSIPHTVRSIPFAGGLGIESAWPRPYVSNQDHYRIAINDKSELLINLYRYARDNPEDFFRLIDGTPYSQSEHREAVRICNNPVGHSDARKAWAYYVNIQMSFSNKLNAGWATSVFGRNQSSTWQSHTRRIPSILQRFKDVYIGCEDALSFIERWDSPQTLHYLDPPYLETDQGHYDGYTIEDWQRLCDLLDSIQGSYVLSNSPQIIEPQSAQQRIEIAVITSASGQGKVGTNRDKSRAPTAEKLGDRQRTEVLWVCDRSANMRGELQKAVAQQHQGNLLDLLGG
jgi:DNA adenine methylase